MIFKSLSKYTVKNILSKSVLYFFLTLAALFFFIPFLFALSTSFTWEYGIYEKGYNWLWHELDFSNYQRLFNEYNIIGSFLNSIAYLIPPVFVGVFTSAMAAFGFARLRFPGRDIVFFVLLSTMVIPGVITMIPSYIMYAKIYRWTNTPLPLIVPGMFGAATTMFFIRQYFLTLPRELEDAAMIDGMNWWGIFTSVAVPLSKAVLITQIILSFNGVYNDYLGPLLYVGTVDEYKTLQLVLSSISTAHQQPYTLMMAGAIVALIPTFILYLIAQKSFIEGIVMTGIKG